MSVIDVVAFFSKCLLGGLAIFVMADNTEKKEGACTRSFVFC
jgi:hypothetical protein